MNEYQRALSLRSETAAHRRYLHRHAETGLNTPLSCAYIRSQLSAIGVESRPCGHGVSAAIGSGGKCMLLRADMDALPMKEESGEPFACRSGTAAHACGHDMHAAMLLTAARLLKQREKDLRGTVRLMFQPGEETFEGAKDMIEHGILEGVDAALAYHVAAGRLPAGVFMYQTDGAMMLSADPFRITVRGRGAHGGYPHKAVDPLCAAAHILLALQSLVQRETDPEKTGVLTVGSIHAGSAANAIPDTAVLEGVIRAGDSASRALLVKRMKGIAEKAAQVFGAEADAALLPGVPALVCHPELTAEIAGYMQQLAVPGASPAPGITASASEDFALIAQHVPSAFMYLSAGWPDARGDAPAHHPKVRFSEDVLPIGSAYYAFCARRWLESHA